MTIELDRSDREILKALQENARISNVDLSKRVFLSPPATHARVKRLDEQGLISKYVALLDRDKTGHDCMCFISVSLELHQTEKQQQFFQAIRKMPQVLECYHLTGESDYLLKVVIKNNREMEQFITQSLLPMPGMAHVRTSVVLREIKSETALPLD